MILENGNLPWLSWEPILGPIFIYVSFVFLAYVGIGFGMQKYFKRKFANRKRFGFCEDLRTCWEAEKREQLEDWNVYRKWEEKVNCSPHYSQTEYKG